MKLSLTDMTKEEFLTQLKVHIIEHIEGGYFMNPDEDEEGYNHDELQALIEHFDDDCGFDVYENDLSYQRLADEYEELIFEHYC